MSKIIPYVLTALFLIAGVGNLTAQDFDFSKLENEVEEYSVIIDMKIEVSFGIHTTDQTEQYLGTIVNFDIKSFHFVFFTIYNFYNHNLFIYDLLVL